MLYRFYTIVFIAFTATSIFAQQPLLELCDRYHSYRDIMVHDKELKATERNRKSRIHTDSAHLILSLIVASKEADTTRCYANAIADKAEFYINKSRQKKAEKYFLHLYRLTQKYDWNRYSIWDYTYDNLIDQALSGLLLVHYNRKTRFTRIVKKILPIKLKYKISPWCGIAQEEESLAYEMKSIRLMHRLYGPKMALALADTKIVQLFGIKKDGIGMEQITYELLSELYTPNQMKKELTENMTKVKYKITYHSSNSAYIEIFKVRIWFQPPNEIVQQLLKGEIIDTPKEILTQVIQQSIFYKLIMEPR